MSEVPSTTERLTPSEAVPAIPRMNVERRETTPSPSPVVLSSIRPVAPSSSRRVFLRIELTPELDETLEEMAKQVDPGGYTKMMRDALGLLKIALDGRNAGKRLMLVDDRDDSEQEITL